MKQMLLMIALVGLVGCGKSKEEAKVKEPEGDRKPAEQSVTKKRQSFKAQTGRLIAAKLSEGIVTVAKKPSLVIKDFKGDINNVVWSPDSSKIMAGTVGVSDEQGKLSPAQVKVWDVAIGKELLTVVTPNASRNGVAWSPDGGRLAIKSGGGFSFADGTQAPGRLRIVAAKNGDPQISIEAKSQFMKEVISWSPDGRSLSGLIEDGVAIWEAAKGKRVQTLDYTDSEQSVRTLGWSPDGSRIAVGCDEAIVDIRSISNGKVLKTFKGGFMKIGNQSIKLPSFSTMVNSVAWSPNGKLVASANNHKVTIWGIASGTEVGAFASGTEHLAWSPDGTRLAGSTREHTTTDSITVWNVTRNAAGRRFVAHQRGVSSSAWSPDGTKLVTGGKERGGGFLEETFTLKIWSLTRGSTQPETKAAPKAEPKTTAPPKAGAKKSEPTKTFPTNLIVEKEIRSRIKMPTGELTEADLEKVTKLDLDKNQLTVVKGLEKLTQLTGLRLDGNQLTDVKGLEKLTQLKELELAANPDLTKAQIAELQKALPKCEISSNPTK